jgi:xylulokinase
VNSFAHVNHDAGRRRVGVLLCINGTGIMNRWIRELAGKGYSYKQMDEMAGSIALGSEGVLVLPFGNGAERMLENKMPGASFSKLQFTVHSDAHLFRAVQEGIACAFRYGFDIMRENGLKPSVIRAGRANMFRSDLFTDLFVNLIGVPVELYENDGSVGAAIGAGIGAGIFKTPAEAFRGFNPVKVSSPATSNSAFENLYAHWKDELDRVLN